MLIVGLIDVFRASFLVIPLLFLVMELSVIIRNVSTHKQLTFKSIGQIFKSLLLLAAGALFLRLLSLLPGVGLSSAGVGALAILISTNDPTLKVLCPFLAPGIAKISSLLNEINLLDNQFMKSVRENRSIEERQEEERVIEIDEDDKDIPKATTQVSRRR
jgi:hypothetical protein